MELEVLKYIAAGLGAGLAVIGGALGIGKIGVAALDATGRQPEVANTARVTMIIAAALVEGATFFGLIICFMMVTK
ncbi:MAG: ATP synthase F0 subunit C [Elusimicrobiota bacterium]|jgi:F-type H+-transporting ATPase subunit c|nr:ATP synthase F0 subunit C [Elusimicrobiota bacterium]